MNATRLSAAGNPPEKLQDEVWGTSREAAAKAKCITVQ